MHKEVPVKLDLAALQSSGPLLWEKKLRPGDVLLVCGNSPFSSLIVKASGGPYSHAAIWIHGGDSGIESLYLAESDTSGVGFTFLLPMRLYPGGHSTAEKVICIPENPREWILLRHPECENIDLSRMIQASKDLQENDFYKTYSAVPRLLEAITLPDFPHLLAKHVAQAIESCRFDKGTRGAFCSELVATFFSRLGLELFTDGRDPQTVSPNDFLLPECRLTVVTDAFVDADSLLPGTYGYGTPYQKRSNDPFLRTMISNRDVYDKIAASMKGAERAQQEASAWIIAQHIKNASAMEHQFAEQIALAERWHENEYVEKLQHYAIMFKYSHRLLQNVYELNHHYWFGDNPLIDIAAWNQASATLQFSASQMLYCAQRALIRNTALSGLRRIRSIHKVSPPGRIQLVKFRRLRANNLKLWCQYKKDSYASLDSCIKFSSAGVPGEQATAYIQDVIQKTHQSLIDEYTH
ncbi:hypothetical protein [Citrobacter sp. Igbk 14]|uniref:hypothetical protein n=1 Tax=Citrobacter sp. Igbk 14 TaxID=2963960 RepID=UPI00230239B7|nr:hypothetical protein [Citrobacter sp. Igbk 14]MDA8511162.1 hypothetical protein [Citrobacter sp. Igbk 14]